LLFLARGMLSVIAGRRDDQIVAGDQ